MAACGGGGTSGGGTDGGESTASAGGYTLSARGGIYDTGSRRGLSLLVALRDGAGRGPEVPWSLALRAPASPSPVDLVYDDASSGSWSAWWWESIEPASGTFELAARNASAAMSVRLSVPERAGLAAPHPSLSASGAAIAWEAVEGAGSYSCRVYAGAAQATASAPSAATACDVGGLAEGSYTASVLAFSADLPALGNDVSPAPALPAAFHVAEGRLGFLAGGAIAEVQLRAAGGAMNFGPASGGLAVWMAIGTADGAAPAEAWAVTVIGPGLSSSAPLRSSYPGAAYQHLLWSYDVPPRSGTYNLTAEAGAKRLAASFAIGEPSRIPIVAEATVAPLPSGAAEVSFTALPEARSYRVSAWAAGATSATAALWTASPPARFGAGTFQAETRYDVYVAATDADMTLAAAPPGREAIAASENAYRPASFTAP